jgi:hypothetical protein
MVSIGFERSPHVHSGQYAEVPLLQLFKVSSSDFRCLLDLMEGEALLFAGLLEDLTYLRA